jgi:CxxC motif-containing protein
LNSDIDVTCILCPIGCEIRVNRKNLSIVDGAKCKRGIEYAKNEIINPRRIITTSMYVKNGEIPLVSVKTSRPTQR